MEPECKVRLEVFEGPLDLLLHLIKKNQLDISDIPISLVTNQYLEYLEFLQSLDIEVAAEYLVMAATLIQIKSRWLLPRHQESQGPEDEDPRLEITRALKELQEAKELSRLLDSRPILGRDVFVAGAPRERGVEANLDRSPAPLDINIIELVEAFKQVLKGQRLPRNLEIRRAKLDMAQRMEEIKQQMIQGAGQVSFFSLFPKGMKRAMVIVTFLAILELAKAGFLRLFQRSTGSDIILVRRIEDSAEAA